MAEKYLLLTTTGPSHSFSTHQQVPVNDPEQTVKVSSDLIDAEVCVRVKGYRGLPRTAPTGSVYFESGGHAGRGDLYSIAVRFRLKDPGLAGNGNGNDGEQADDPGEEDWQPADEGEDSDDSNSSTSTPPRPGVPATDLQFGNDFDHPIRDRLPPGFGTALNIVKWWIDPGLDGDPYADRPYLYGPALSSFNAVHVGGGELDPDKGGLWFDEGGDEEGIQWRRERGVPDDAAARMKWALKAGSKEAWTWEYGRTYGVDFFNPYIDFHEFALRLPGFSLPIMKYWDGQGLRNHKPKRSHQLRYVLRNRVTGQVYLVVLFTLLLAEDVNEDGTLKPGMLGAEGQPPDEDNLPGSEPELELEPDEEDFSEEEALREARRKTAGVGVSEAGTGEDDVD
ncbi:hypothetical protein C8A05DRAFT_46899 [Staphylotrichum tortipilum]|uniref:Domain of unknown function at the cortex 1 domain-containing protein n=1 Tax=Staphylotrichum tortipilum TaxID=2831512 RepID=A0AAN6MDN3_9PEZI|nr:hypothetical protein C8A05DRAFT_46899 [Staphylotrichum longicolle]